MSFPIHEIDCFTDPLSSWSCIHIMFELICSSPVVFTCLVQFFRQVRTHLAPHNCSDTAENARLNPLSREPLWSNIVKNCCWKAKALQYSKAHPRFDTLILPPLCIRLLLLPPSGLFRFHEDIENMVQVLEVTLSGGKASMVLLMPFHVENLSRLEKLLTVERLSKWLDKTNVTSVSVSLPKANITSTLSLQVSTFFYHVWML